MSGAVWRCVPLPPCRHSARKKSKENRVQNRLKFNGGGSFQRGGRGGGGGGTSALRKKISVRKKTGGGVVVLPRSEKTFSTWGKRISALRGKGGDTYALRDCYIVGVFVCIK